MTTSVEEIKEQIAQEIRDVLQRNYLGQPFNPVAVHKTVMDLISMEAIQAVDVTVTEDGKITFHLSGPLFGRCALFQ